MEPVLLNGERVKLVKSQDIKVGDIIAFKIFSQRIFVKSVIAVAGDSIDRIDGVLLRNQKKMVSLKQTEIPCTRSEYKKIKSYLKDGILKSNYYLVLSEKSSNRFDSRKYGAIHSSQIVGKLVTQ